MSGRTADSRRYVSRAYVDQLVERLAARDWKILTSLHAVRVLTGAQLERLHFSELSAKTKARTRRAVLSRLAEWHVIAPLERRIGGVRGGSAGLIWTLDTAGQRLMRQRFYANGDDGIRTRRPWTPGQMFLQHSLAVAEAYVSLIEQSRVDDFQLTTFHTEPLSWWPNGIGGMLKPDAYLVAASAKYEDTWWLEMDMATESAPTLRRKLSAYLDFNRRGAEVPDDVMPRVLVAVPTPARRKVVEAVIARLPEPASQLLCAVDHERIAQQISEVLRK